MTTLDIIVQKKRKRSCQMAISLDAYLLNDLCPKLEAIGVWLS